MQSSMENPARTQEKRENLSSTNSAPRSNGLPPIVANGGGASARGPLTQKSIPIRSEPNPNPNPNPITYVQTNTTNFKQVVQMLTGSSETVKSNSVSLKSGIPPIRAPQKNKQQGFKLYERRNHLNNTLIINTLAPGFAGSRSPIPSPAGFSPRHSPEITSPSMLNFPNLVLSPATPLNPDDPFNSSSSSSSSGEEKAIDENTPRGTDPPQLLQLFPMTSPRMSGTSPDQ